MIAVTQMSNLSLGISFVKHEYDKIWRWNVDMAPKLNNHRNDSPFTACLDCLVVSHMSWPGWLLLKRVLWPCSMISVVHVYYRYIIKWRLLFNSKNISFFAVLNDFPHILSGIGKNHMYLLSHTIMKYITYIFAHVICGGIFFRYIHISICLCLWMLTHEMPTLRGQQRPFSTVNSCSWNNWNFIKRKIAHPWWNSNPRLFN